MKPVNDHKKETPDSLEFGSIPPHFLYAARDEDDRVFVYTAEPFPSDSAWLMPYDATTMEIKPYSKIHTQGTCPWYESLVIRRMN